MHKHGCEAEKREKWIAQIVPRTPTIMEKWHAAGEGAVARGRGVNKEKLARGQEGTALIGLGRKKEGHCHDELFVVIFLQSFNEREKKDRSKKEKGGQRVQG